MLLNLLHPCIIYLTINWWTHPMSHIGEICAADFSFLNFKACEFVLWHRTQFIVPYLFYLLHCILYCIYWLSCVATEQTVCFDYFSWTCLKKNMFYWRPIPRDPSPFQHPKTIIVVYKLPSSSTDIIKYSLNLRSDIWRKMIEQLNVPHNLHSWQ